MCTFSTMSYNTVGRNSSDQSNNLRGRFARTTLLYHIHAKSLQITTTAAMFG